MDVFVEVDRGNRSSSVNNRQMLRWHSSSQRWGRHQHKKTPFNKKMARYKVSILKKTIGGKCRWYHQPRKKRNGNAGQKRRRHPRRPGSSIYVSFSFFFFLFFVFFCHFHRSHPGNNERMRRPGISDEVFRPQNAHLRRVTGSLKKRFFCVIGSLERDTCKREREREREGPRNSVFCCCFFFTKKNRQRKETNNKNNRDDKKKRETKIEKRKAHQVQSRRLTRRRFHTRKKNTIFISPFYLFIYLFFWSRFFSYFFPFSITNARR